MAQESKIIDTELQIPQEAKPMGLAETVVLVGKYMREMCSDRGVPILHEIAARLGWTVPQLQAFRDENAQLLALDLELAAGNPPDPVLPPTDADMLEPGSVGQLNVPDGAPIDEELALAVKTADEKLMNGLKAIGLNEKEVEIAQALQKFNQGHFRDSMDIVTTSVLRTDLKCVDQQDQVTQRLAMVRQQIASYDGFASEERDMWVKEERLLMQQFLELGQLTVNIQDTWYRGAAQLALMQMRWRQDGGSRMTQRNNKPGFRPARKAS